MRISYYRLMSNNISATEFMESFSGGEQYAPTPEAKADPRGEPVDIYEDGRWIKVWSNTGEVAR